MVKFAEGSCFVKFGETHVLVTATLEDRLPPWLKGQGRGWITAEYGMLPRATLERTRREASAGKQSGRTVEIQRLIGRSLRSVVDLKALGERQITIDCDVIQADGGTRTASITGAWIALYDCLAWMKTRDMVQMEVLRDHIAAISCGVHGGVAVLDLDYAEDSQAVTVRLWSSPAPAISWKYKPRPRRHRFPKQSLPRCWRWRARASASWPRLAEDGRRMTDDRRRTTEKQPAEPPSIRRLSSAVRRPITGRLVIATHNPGKLAEMRELLAPYGIDAISAGELDLPEPDEDGMSFRDNARIKAEAAAIATGLPAFADDFGLVVDALDGAPGIHSARWAGPEKNFRRAMETIQVKLYERGATTPERRKANFVSALCVAWPDGHVEDFEARSTARWSGRRAATKVSATIRCSCPTATRALLAKCRATHGLPPRGQGLSHRARAFMKLAEACLGSTRLAQR